MGSCFINCNCFFSIKSWSENQLLLIEIIAAEVCRTVPKNNNRRDWQGGLMVLLVCYFNDFSSGVGSNWITTKV